MSERITKHRRSGNNAMTHLIRSTGPDATSAPAGTPTGPANSRPDPSGSRHEGGNRHDGWRDTPTGSWRLVERAQAGDVQAFGALYDRYNNEVYKYLWLRCGHIQLAQDLTSDVWERALRSIGRLQFQGVSPVGWLLTIARNRAIDHFRSGRFRLEVFDEETARADRPDTGVGVEDAVLSRTDAARLLEAVKRLPAPQQEAIALTYFCGLNSREASQVMGKTPEAVKALTLRGRRQLIRILPDESTD